MTFEPLSASQRRGAIVVAVFALLSALALTFIALRTIRLAMILFHKHDNSTSRPPEILFFRTQLGHYAGCLLLSNMFISAAGLIDFRWASRSGSSQGSTCSAQAVLMQIGIWGTCWFTVAHGFHTLSSLGFHIRPARWRSSVCVSLGWTITFVAGLAPLRKNDMYGRTGTSCNLTPSYPEEILPIIFVAFVSTTIYSVIFIELHEKLGVHSTPELRDLNLTNQRGDDDSEEYFKFISTIIWTMFWFPIAFVLLLLPFCITHTLMYVGHPVSSASSVFADACVSMLGLVNVVLLCNTLRVISPVYHGFRARNIVRETVMTFGHDASGELPSYPKPTFYSQSAIRLHERNRRMYYSTQSPSNHLGSSSRAGVYPNRRLPGGEKTSYESTQMNVAPPVLNGVMPPAKLNRYAPVIPPQISTERQNINLQSEMLVDSPPRTARLVPYPPRVSFVTGPSNQDKERSFQRMVNSDNLGKGAKEPTCKSKAPLAMEHSHLSVPQPKVNTCRPEITDESNSRSSFASTMTVSTDSDSDYSGEIKHACKVPPLAQVPGPSNHERYPVTSPPLAPPRLRGRSYMTVATVWSQESGYTGILAVDMAVPRVIGADQADVGEAMSRQAISPSLSFPETPARSWSTETFGPLDENVERQL